MRHLFIQSVAAALLLALFAPPSNAQSTLLQAGPLTPGHAPMYVNSGSSQAVVQDSGTAGGGVAGATLSELGVTVRAAGTPPFANAGTGPNHENICDYDAPINNPNGGHSLCLSPNALGGGLLSYQAFGTASPLPFNFLINGVPGFPYSVLQPIPATAVLMNPTSATAAVQAATIQGLGPDSSPDAINDYLLIYQASSGTLKKVNPSSISTSVGSGVTSIGGTSGVIALGDGIAISSSTLFTHTPISTATSTGSVTGSQKLILCDATSGNVALTIPTASTVNNGATLTIKRKDATSNTCTIVGSIDGLTTVPVAPQYASVTLTSDGSSQWWIQ